MSSKNKSDIKRLPRKRCKGYGGTDKASPTIVTSRNYSFRHISLLTTGSRRRLNRPVRLIEEDGLSETKEGGVLIRSSHKDSNIATKAVQAYNSFSLRYKGN